MLMSERLVSFLPSKTTISMAYLISILPVLIALTGCAGEGAGGSGSDTHLAHADGGDDDPIITMTPSPSGFTAQLTWEAPPNFKATSYDVYYAKRSSAEVSLEQSESSDEQDAVEVPSCTGGTKQTVDGPQATITGLDSNTQYVFAIRAFNEDQSESLCSNEITVETTPTES